MSDFKYFGGSSVHSNKLRALPCYSFQELFEHALKFPILIAGISRREYHKLDKADRNKKKDVAYLSPSCYGEEHARRSDGDIVHCNLLAFDIDDSDEARQFVDYPELLSTQLDPYNFVAYHSASSTNRNPRIRILVDARRINKLLYPKAVGTLARRLGVTVNKESRTPALPMYRPTAFAGEKLNPVFLASLDGDQFRERDIQEFDDAGKQKETTKISAELDDFDHLKATVTAFTKEHAKECLSFIDPDVERGEWVNIGMALKHQFGDEIGYQLFLEWSEDGEKFETEEKTRYIWDSCSQSPKARDPITARSLLKKAADGGWSAEAVVALEVQSVERQIEILMGTRSEIVAQALAMIAKIPQVNVIDEDALFDVLNKTTFKLFKQKASISTLRKHLAKLRRDKNFSNKKIKDDLFQWYNDFCYVSKQDKFVSVTTMEDFTAEALDRAFGNLFIPEMTSKDKGKLIDLAPEIMPQRYLLLNCDIKRVYDERYDPTSSAKFVQDQDIEFLNTYKPNYPDPDPALEDYCGDVFQDHMVNLIREPEYARVITEWMAFIVQNPGRKIRWSPLIQGAPGCGKTFLAELLKAVLGDGNVNMVEASAVGQQWNEWAANCQVVALEEIRIAGHNRHEIVNKIKPLITNSNISISKRNVDHRTAPNHTNYILFTNFHDSIPVDSSDRRYFVIKSRLQTEDQVAELGAEYFNELFSIVYDFPGGARSYFLNYKIRKSFSPDGNAPKTTYHKELVDNTSSDDKLAFREFLENGNDPRVAEDLISSRQLLLQFETEGLMLSPRKLGLLLSDEGYQKLTSIKLDGMKHYLWGRAGSKWQIADSEDVKEEFLARNQQSQLLG